MPHALNTVIESRARETEVAIGPDYTRCGLCVDSCPTGALSCEIRNDPGLTDFRPKDPVDRSNRLFGQSVEQEHHLDRLTGTPEWCEPALKHRDNLAGTIETRQ